MTTTDTGVPTLQEEIDRKAFEQLERLAGQLEIGKITEAQFDAGVMSVWHCVSGLCSKPIMDAISAVQEHRKGNSFQDRRLYIKPTGTPGHFSLVITTRTVGQGEVSMITLPAQPARKWDFSDEPNPSKAALVKQIAIGEKVMQGGYRQL